VARGVSTQILSKCRDFFDQQCRSKLHEAADVRRLGRVLMDGTRSAISIPIPPSSISLPPLYPSPSLAKIATLSASPPEASFKH
jgi:hypothetical protein